jgi:hypothetical protein
MREIRLSPNGWVGLALVALLGVMGFVVTLDSLGFSLLSSTTNTATTSSLSGMEFYTANGLQELTIIRGGTTGQALKWLANGQIGWDDDATTTVTGAGALALDLTDDDVNESSALVEIATTGDTNSIFTEPSADKLLIDAGQNWPGADTATALAADPADCGANAKADAIAANGALTCSAVDTGDITDGTILPADLNDGADTPVDEDCLTYEDTGPAFEWQTCGAGSNSFETQNVPAGTDPVADAANDTLNWTSTGSTITLTGDATSDTINVEAVDVTCTGCLGTTEIAGLDISDDTNLAGGRSITLSGDSVEADAELFTDMKSVIILNPTTSETNLVQLKFPLATTLTRVSCSTNTGTVTIQLDERAEGTPNTAGTDMLTSALVCDSDTEATTSFSNATADADDPVNLQITATASTPGVVRIHVDFTYDD